MLKSCAECGESIELDINTVDGVIKYDKKFYHTWCFCSLCNTKLASKRCKKEKWEQALQDINEIESNTITSLRESIYRDKLNLHLLSNYNIVEVPKRFMMMINELSVGKHRGRMCKPVQIELLFNVWSWGQSNLDKINHNNKKNNKGPTNDSDRLFYDLAILLKKIPDYIKQVEEEKTNIDKFNREADEYFANIY